MRVPTPDQTVRSSVLRRYSIAAFAAALSVLMISAFPDTATFAFDIPQEDLAQALNQIARQSHIEIAYSAELTRGKVCPSLKGTYTAEQALKKLLKGSGLRVRRIVSGALVIEKEGAGKAHFGRQRPTSKSDATVQFGRCKRLLQRGRRGRDWSRQRAPAADGLAREFPDRPSYEEMGNWHLAARS
jgi:hypothetical protein